MGFLWQRDLGLGITAGSDKLVLGVLVEACLHHWAPALCGQKMCHVSPHTCLCSVLGGGGWSSAAPWSHHPMDRVLLCS